MLCKHTHVHQGRWFHSDQLQTQTRLKADGMVKQCIVPSVGKHLNALAVLLAMCRLCSVQTRSENRTSISDVTHTKNSSEGKIILRYSEGKHTKTIALWRVNTKTTCMHPLLHANDIPNQGTQCSVFYTSTFLVCTPRETARSYDRKMKNK